MNAYLGVKAPELQNPDLLSNPIFQERLNENLYSSEDEGLMNAANILSDEFNCYLCHENPEPALNIPSLIYDPSDNKKNIFGKKKISIDVVEKTANSISQKPVGMHKIKHDILKSKGWIVEYIVHSDTENNYVDSIKEVLKKYKK